MRGCRPLEKTEVEQAIGYFSVGSRIRERDRCLFLLGLYTGFRISELLSLRVWDVCQYNRVLTRVRVERQNMKGKRESREVPLTLKARKALARWLPTLIRWRGNLPDTFLFQSQLGGCISRQQAWRIMADMAAQFGMEPGVGCHSLRKTFGMSAYAQANKHWRPGRENPLRQVMKALGHASVGTTERYLGLDMAEVDSLVLGIDYGEEA